MAAMPTPTASCRPNALSATAMTAAPTATARKSRRRTPTSGANDRTASSPAPTAGGATPATLPTTASAAMPTPRRKTMLRHGVAAATRTACRATSRCPATVARFATPTRRYTWCPRPTTRYTRLAATAASVIPTATSTTDRIVVFAIGRDDR